MRALPVFLLPFLVLACGGHVTSSGTPSNSSDDGDNDENTDTPGRDMPHGSYDLTFTSVTATPTFAGELPSVSPASTGKNARLDIGDNGTSTVTPRWGSPASFEFDLNESSVSIGLGSATFSENTTYYVTDTWAEIKVDRSSEGDLTGTFSATGTEEITEGDEVFEATLTASGNIAHDETPPDVRLGPVPSSGLLPWESIPLQFAEPIEGSVLDIVSVSPAVAAAVTTYDAQSLRATLLMSNWGITSANVVTQPFDDRAGNASDLKAFNVAFFDPGPATAGFTFDGPGANPAKWDDASLVSYLASDASCESGGCAKIGPLGDHGCTIPNTGIAGVLNHDISHLGSDVIVRYRILVGLDSSGGGGGEITPDASVFSVETAAPGGDPSTRTFGFALADLKTIPSTFGMTQATDWTTATIPVTAANNLGFGIRFGSSTYCGGPIFNENSTVVLIDSITTD